MSGWTGALVEGGGGANGLVCNRGEYHTYEMEPHPQGSIPQYTTVYHSIPQYTTVYYSIPQYTTVYHSILQYNIPQYIIVTHIYYYPDTLLFHSTLLQFQRSFVSEGGRKPLLKFQ